MTLPYATTKPSLLLHRRRPFLLVSATRGTNRHDDEDDGDVDQAPPMDLPGDEYPDYDEEDLRSLTVLQLKQQLRLRGYKLSGRKSDLIERLLNRRSGNVEGPPEVLSAQEAADQVSEARAFSEKEGKELIDVTAYLDEDDQGKATKSLASAVSPPEDDFDTDESTTTEVWGAEARLMVPEDDPNKRLVIDSLSRTVLEFKGSNQTYVQAVVVATRDALKPYLAGGYTNRTAATPVTTATATEQRLRELQWKREKEAATPVRFGDTDGLDEGDETGIFENVLHREVSDWGKYTVTGAQLSAQEVQGVLLLTDVYGAFLADTTALAEKIAFECQPVIVMIPDLFRGSPWVGSLDRTNPQGQTYEQWRATHDDLRVSVDIRAAAACLRETYGVSSVVVWGLCYGGGRALEAAAGWYESIHDVDGTTIGPPPVEPMVAVVWYPTRYNARALFGKQHRGRNLSVLNGDKRKLAVIAVFAGNDLTSGATQKDAATLKQLLEEDDRVVDHMVKVFQGQEHGFAHIGLGLPQQYSDELQRFSEEEFGGAGKLVTADGEAEVACLLSTAFMETYSRVFLPTVGAPISVDEQEKGWGRELFIKDLRKASTRNIRDEINEAIDNFVEEPLMSGPRIDATDESQEEALAKLLRSMQDPEYDGPYKISDDDDLPSVYKKLLSSDENFQIF